MRKISARTMGAVGGATAGMLIAFAVFANLSATRNHEARQAIPRHGNIFQSGALAGWASGAKISQFDSAVVEFDQISHARQLAQQDEFEYGGMRMRISQVVQVEYPRSSEATTGRGAERPDKTLLRVTARIQRAP
jgi:hypothetical protein